MNIRLVLSGLAACTTLCAMPPIAGAKIFPMIYVTTSGRAATAAASPFGGSGTITLFGPTSFGQPQVLVQSLAMPKDIAVSDGIIYAVIAGNGIVSAFSASDGHLITGTVVNVPKGPPVGIAAFGGNVFVANSLTNTISEYTRSGGAAVASISKDVRHPTEITASGGNLFVVNQGTGNVGEYISEYTTSGNEVAAQLIKGLQGPIKIGLSGTDLFVMHLSGVTMGGTIDEYDLSTGTMKPFLTGLHGPTDIAVSGVDLFVTDVPNHSIDVYDIATRQMVGQITGLNGPQGIDIAVPDQSSTWLLLLLATAATFGFKIMLRQPA
jgi:hypothetical protein